MATHLKKTWRLTAVLYSSPSQHSDVVIVVEGKKLYFYKQLLCLVSPVFKAMLCSEFKEKQTQTVNLQDKRFADIVMLLAWIDPANAINHTVDEADILLPLADEYDISNLREFCQTILQSVLPTAQAKVVLQSLKLADEHNASELSNAAIKKAAEMDLDTLQSDQRLYNDIDHSSLTNILERGIRRREGAHFGGLQITAQLERRTSAQTTGFSFGTTQGFGSQNKKAVFSQNKKAFASQNKQAFASQNKEVVASYQQYKDSESVSSESLDIPPEEKNPHQTLVIVGYCTSSELTDVAVVVDGTKLYFYSDVLRRTSSSFCNKLDSMEGDGEISLEVGTAQDVSLVLEFLDPSCDKKILNNVKTALQLFWLSLEYDIPVLHEACENYLMLNISNCDKHDITWCILLADRGKCPELKTAAFAETEGLSITDLKETDCYKQMDPVTRIQLLEFKIQC